MFMLEGQFEFSPEVFGADDRRSVEAVVEILDRACAQNTDTAAEDILYDFCVAYREEFEYQDSGLPKEASEKRLRVIVQWYAEHARNAEGERLLSGEAAADIQNNWDEWLDGPESLFSGFLKKRAKKKAERAAQRQAEAESAPAQQEPEFAPAQQDTEDFSESEEEKPRAPKPPIPFTAAIIGMVVCFAVGLGAGYALGYSGGTAQPITTTSQTTENNGSGSGEPTEKDSETDTDDTVNSSAVMLQSMNVREAPTTEDEDNILTTLSAGDDIVVLSQPDENNWVQISCEDEDGDPVTGYIKAVYDGESTYGPADSTETDE